MSFLLVWLAAIAALAVHAAAVQPPIRHVVVLVMENRAFDHMLGMKSATNPRIDGCPLGTKEKRCANRAQPTNVTSPLVFVGNQAIYVQPADPGHSVVDTGEQLFGTLVPQPIGIVLCSRRLFRIACM